jgi:hypothetical protein
VRRFSTYPGQEGKKRANFRHAVRAFVRAFVVKKKATSRVFERLSLVSLEKERALLHRFLITW